MKWLIMLTVAIATCVYVTEQQKCDIVIVGGTLAALGAALHASNRLKTCLVELTDRVGGQLGDEGVWHFDFNWLYQKDYPDTTIAYNPANIPHIITELMQKCNTGDCWVSRTCFLYSCIEPIIKSHLQQSENLVYYYNTTVKSVRKAGDRIAEVQIISRLPLQTRQDQRSVDQVIADWYTRQSSEYYRKIVRNLVIEPNGFVIEASQYGDVLVQANASYMQGTEDSVSCGQSIVFGIHQIYPENGATNLQVESVSETYEDDGFSLDGFTTEQVWRYRRLYGSGLGIKPGEISLQNWNGPGNDYRQGYLFVDAVSQRFDWQGGLNFTTLKQAEELSLRYHGWFKAQTNLPLDLYKKETGTYRGTTRLPYVRDGRRSVGYKDFILKSEDVSGVYKKGGSLTATVFDDRVSIGMYNMDLHQIEGCVYRPFAQNIPLPFFIPLRAYSNKDVSNMIVSGRALAQQFFVSSATRTHATELATGIAAISIANFMMRNQIPNTWSLIDCSECLHDLQTFIRDRIPLQWTINGTQYPPAEQNKFNRQ